jgi:hypothetical protein
LFIVAVLSAQLTILSSGTSLRLWPDSASYISAANSLAAGIPIDPVRTPAYPLLLAPFLQGNQVSGLLLFVQALLLVVGGVEWFVLAASTGIGRTASWAIASLVTVNLEVLVYERFILTEALAAFLVVTVLLTFRWWLTQMSWKTGGLMLIESVVLVLCRPALLPVMPTLLLVAVGYRVGRNGGWKPVFKTAILLGAFGALLLSYSLSMQATYGFFGLSYLDRAVGFEKVIEYRMELLPTHGAYGQLPAATHQFVQDGGNSAFIFARQHPQFAEHYWDMLGRYAIDVIVNNPVPFLRGTFRDCAYTLAVPPRFGQEVSSQSTPFGAIVAWKEGFVTSVFPSPIGHILQPVTELQCLLYALLPATIAANVGWWRLSSRQVPAVLWASVTLVCTVGVVVAASAWFTGFGRLRLPFDQAIVASTIATAMGLRETLSARRG